MVLAAQNHKPSGAPDLKLVQRLEAIEAEAYFDLYASAPDDIAEALGLHIYRSRGALATLATKSDVLALNRVGGIGLYADVDPIWLASLLAEFRRAKVRRAFFNRIPFSPDARLDEKFTAAGLRYHNNWVKLYRDCSPLLEFECDLDIRPLQRRHADDFGRIFAGAVGWPDAAGTLLAGLVGRDNWYTFGAFDGNKLVATAALYARGQTGVLTFASTLPAYRGRGVQKALVQRRIAEAARLGCTLCAVETGQNRPGHDVPSHRNMIRCGFSEAYVRGNYVWERRAGD